jgi:phage terminase large subunit-like protein
MTRTDLATLKNSVEGFLKDWDECAENEQIRLLMEMKTAEVDFLTEHWGIFAHAHQTPPDLAPNGSPWHTWLMIGGRGAGKTRAGAEWVRAQALGLAPFATEKAARIALVGETEHDVREVMIEGVSGLLAVHGWHERPVWLPSRKRLEWSDGQVAQVFSAEDPASLRGPQFSCSWSDEMAKWRYAQDAFDMLQFGLRLGAQPRQLITTTPRPRQFLKRLIEDPTSVVTRATTRDNANNLAPTFLRTVMGRYAGTVLGRQELEGRSSRTGPTRCGRARCWRSAASARRRRCSASWSRSIRRPVRAGAPPAAASSLPASRRTAPAM